jgi:predicted acylesterase/phospholipase RssA
MDNGGKTALVLAGGGLTGAVYEIGALRAIDDLLVDRTVNDFDIYVGTSAGALVASGLANGISPEVLLQAIDGSHPNIRPIEPRHVFNVGYLDLMNKMINLPTKLLGAWLKYLRQFGDMTFFDLLWSFTEALPAGLYDGMALEEYIREMLVATHGSNHFDELDRELYIIATDLDSGERVVFGPGSNSHVNISLAVAASAALPLLYKPVRIGEHEYVDGGLRGNASLDLAIENGAKLVVCINPMVPHDHTKEGEDIPFHDSDGGHLSDRGLPAIAAQLTRIITHAGLHYHIKQLRRQYPDVDILLIEPRSSDLDMFFGNIMRYSARLTVARHGFESVTLDLAEQYYYFKTVLARHGIPISRRLVISELAEIQESGYDPEMVRRVLEARSGPCNRYRNDHVTCLLSRTLADLEMTLDRITVDVA